MSSDSAKITSFPAYHQPIHEEGLEEGESPLLSSLQRKVADVYVSRSKAPDVFRGLARSPTLQTVAISVLAGGLAAGILFIVVSSPPVWMIAAVAAGGVGAGLILGIGAQIPFKGKQRVEFELSALRRSLRSKNYNEIFQKGERSPRILLGALPNRLTSDGERLVNGEGVRAFLSINEGWEVDRTNGLQLPYLDEDYNEMGVKLHEPIASCRMRVEDHTLLDDEALNQAADFIRGQAGKTVYVHCRAGVGRSAMAVAAYLIKYERYTVKKACQLIKQNRPESTIMKKVDRLMEYQASLLREEDPDLNARLNELADHVVEKGTKMWQKNPEMKVRDLYPHFPSVMLASYAIKYLNARVDEVKVDLEKYKPESNIGAYTDMLNTFDPLGSP